MMKMKVTKNMTAVQWKCSAQNNPHRNEHLEFPFLNERNIVCFCSANAKIYIQYIYKIYGYFILKYS